MHSFDQSILQAATVAQAPLPLDPENVGYDSRWSVYHAVGVATFGLDLSVEQLCVLFGYGMALEQSGFPHPVSQLMVMAERLVTA